jgi:hypothetical protein
MIDPALTFAAACERVLTALVLDTCAEAGTSRITRMIPAKVKRKQG